MEEDLIKVFEVYKNVDCISGGGMGIEQSNNYKFKVPVPL